MDNSRFGEYADCDERVRPLSILSSEAKTVIIADADILRRRVAIRNSLRSVFERIMGKNRVDIDIIIDEEMEIVSERATEIFEDDKNISLVGAVNNAMSERSGLNNAEVWFEEFAKHVAARMKRMILNDQNDQALDYYGFMQRGQYESTLVVMQREAARTVKKEVARMIKCRENGNAVRSIFKFGGVTGVTISDLQKYEVNPDEMELFRAAIVNVLVESMSEHPYIYLLQRDVVDGAGLLSREALYSSIPVQLTVKGELLKSATVNSEWFEQLCDFFRCEGLLDAVTERNHRGAVTSHDYRTFESIRLQYEVALRQFVRQHPHYERALREIAERW